MLTAKNVTSLPAPERGQKDYADEGLPGFSLRVSASGRRVYTLYYRVRDSVKKRRATLGSASQISLADARQRARELLRDISLGSDPLAFHEMDELAVLCRRFQVEFCSSPDRSASVRESWPRLIDRYILPAIGHVKPTDKSIRARIVEFTDAIARTGKGYMANRIFEITRRIWTWGIEKAVLPHENYPFLRLKKPFLHESRRKRFYNSQEIRSIWTAIEFESEALGAHPDGSRVTERSE